MSTTYSYNVYGGTTSATSDYTWYKWSGDSTSTSVSGYSGSGGTWKQWIKDNEYTITVSEDTWKQWIKDNEYTITVSEETWKQWIKDNEYTYVRYSEPEKIIVPKETTEQKRAKAAQVRINAEWRLIKAKEVEEERKYAEDRAMELLLDILGEDQMEVFKRTGRVFITGNKYQWLVDRDGRVKKITKTTVVDMCVALQSKYSYPQTDNVIAMMLAAKLNEEDFIKKANVVSSDKMKVEDRRLIEQAANF